MSGAAPDLNPTRRRSTAFATLRKRSEFLALAKGSRRSTPAFSLQIGPASGSGGRFGFTVTKKTGNAPERNRIRRRLRAAVAELAFEERPPLDVAVVARRDCLTIPFTRLVADLSGQIASARRKLAAAPTLPGA